MAVRRTRAGRIISLVLRILLVLLIVAVLGILFWRIASSGIPSSLKPILITQKTLDGYHKAGEQFSGYYQNQNTITRSERAYGYFSVPSAVILPDAGQVQIVFQFNHSTVRHLVEDYHLDTRPAYDEDLYDVTLVVTQDKTPEDPNDNTQIEALEQIRIHPSAVKSKSTGLYEFYRLVFDDVPIIPGVTVGVFVDVYYVGDVDYEQEPYGALCIYDNRSENLPYKFKKAELTALKNGQTTS